MKTPEVESLKERGYHVRHFTSTPSLQQIMNFLGQNRNIPSFASMEARSKAKWRKPEQGFRGHVSDRRKESAGSG